MKKSDFDARMAEVSQRYPNVKLANVKTKGVSDMHEQEQDNVMMQDAPLGLQIVLRDLLAQVMQGIPTPVGTRRLKVMDVEAAIREWIETEQAEIDAQREQRYIDSFNAFVGRNAYEYLPPSVRAEISMQMMWQTELGTNLAKGECNDR